MRTPSSSVIALLAAGLGLANASAEAGLDVDATARLASLQRAPETTGELVYRGSVFELSRANGPELFSYERRVAHTDGGLAAAHITKDSRGIVLIAEEARFSKAYALARFDAANAQVGFSGTVRVSDDGRQLDFRLVDNGVASTARERVSAPVVSGPSLHGFVLHHWPALIAGRTIPVRMIALAKKQTYGFDIRLAQRSGGRTTFSITPSSWLVRLAIAPLEVTFDDATRDVVRYEGLVPPVIERGGRREALVARVDYTMAAPGYR